MAKRRPAIIKLRPGQRTTFRHPAGILGRIWRRQYGKSEALGAEAVDTMLAYPGITTVFMSASMRLGQENLLKEAALWSRFLNRLRDADMQITTNADDDAGKLLDVDTLADLLDHTKLEVKLWHSRTLYSRSIVIAPNPDTAVGYTGWLFLDEVGRMPNFRDVWEAAEPFAASNPDFRIRLSTTPPPDDSHYSYEILAPPVEQDFPVDPKGNFYRSSAGFLMHRLDAWDAAAGGVPIFDSETRQPLTPEEARAKAWDKDAWDRNFGVKFLRNTGQAAIAQADIDHAQSVGREIEVGEAIALFEQLPEPGHALDALLRSYLDRDWSASIERGQIGLGLDLATSDKKSSNPSALTVLEAGAPAKARLVLAFKSRDEAATTQIVETIIDDIRGAGKGSQIRGLSIDASNEEFFAQRVAKLLRARGIPVRLVKGGETLTHQGADAPAKVVLGNLYANLFSDQRIALPPAKWLAEDHRLVRRVGGSFEAAVLPDGRHADTFDAGKLAFWELSQAGAVQAEASPVGGVRPAPRPGLLNPFARFFERPRRVNV
jgi:hypothetical protein